jgi:hypothetical protein
VYEPKTRYSPRRAWTVAWLGGVVIGVGNGVLRQATYADRLGERAAHDVSGLTGVTAFAAYFSWLQRRWPLADGRTARAIGAQWLALTVAFEFGFGRLVVKQSWEELLADYNVAEGRTWPFVLAWLAAGPEVTRRLRSAG